MAGADKPAIDGMTQSGHGLLAFVSANDWGIVSDVVVYRVVVRTSQFGVGFPIA